MMIATDEYCQLLQISFGQFGWGIINICQKVEIYTTSVFVQWKKNKTSYILFNCVVELGITWHVGLC